MNKCAVFLACMMLVLTSIVPAGSMTTMGREWTTVATDAEPTYSTIPYFTLNSDGSITATSAWNEYAVVGTELAVKVGDVVSYHVVNTAEPRNHTGTVGPSTWITGMWSAPVSSSGGIFDIEARTYTEMALAYTSGSGMGAARSFMVTWEFTAADTVQLTIDNPETTGLTGAMEGSESVAISNVSDIKGFVLTNYSSEQDMTISDFVHTSAYRTNTPDPTVDETDVEFDLSERTVSGAISWAAPNDPNIVTLYSYDVYFDPNQANVMAGDVSVKVANDQTGTFWTLPADLALDTTYYWRVDTNVDYDYIPGTEPNTVVGNVWWFTTVPPSPEIEGFDNVFTTIALLPAGLSAEVSDGDNNVSSVVFTVLEDDYQYPEGATYTLLPNVSNLYAPTAAFTPDTPGNYKIKLEVSDGTATDTAVALIQVYADACEAAQNNPNGWTANYYDRDGDCDVDILDFSEFALEWLNDTSLQTQDTYE